MNKPNTTPGPWRFEINLKGKAMSLCGGKPLYDKHVLGFERFGMQNGQCSFTVAEEGYMQPAAKLTCIIPGREHHENWFRGIKHPDAQLIEAAPDLATALERCISHFESNKTGGFNGHDKEPEADSSYVLAKEALLKAGYTE